MDSYCMAVVDVFRSHFRMYVILSFCVMSASAVHANAVWRRSSACEAPAIITSPAAQAVVVGSTVQLMTTASGTSLQYQWRHNGSAVAGATSSTYSFPGHPATAGSYDCVVTNSCGMATTSTATVTVNLLGWTLGLTPPGQILVRASGWSIPCAVDWGFELGGIFGIYGQVAPGWWALKGPWDGPATVVPSSTVPVKVVDAGIKMLSKVGDYIATAPCEGGGRALRIGDTRANTEPGWPPSQGTALGARKYFDVTTSHVYYRYALVVEDEHADATVAPYFDLTVRRQRTDEVIHSERRPMMGAENGFKTIKDKHEADQDTGDIGTAYLDWQCRSVDLSAYLGEALYVDVVVTDCKPNPHWGYGYVDFLCSNTCGVGFEITIPNVFTPNGDGINDRWGPIQMENVFALKVDVFNIWGNRVFHSVPVPTSGNTFGPSLLLWNGTHNGSLLPTGTYYYVVVASGCEVTQTYAGTVTIFH